MAAGIGVGMSLVSGVLSAHQTYQQGKAAKYNADYNAKLAKNQAEQGQMEARENVRRQQKNNEAQMSSARARLANQGAIATQGAPLAVMGDIAGQLELSVLDAYRGADANRTRLLQQASLEKARGRDAMRAGRLMAFGTLAQTGATLFSNVKTGNRVGVF